MDSSQLKNKQGGKRLYNALCFSIKGIKAAWKSEAAFREEICLAVVMVPCALWLSVPLVEKILLISVVILVLVTELLNSAIESVVDRIGSEIHPLSGQAKDVGSAAVMFTLFLCAGVWIAILLQHFSN